jgi:hypothetical protein
MKNYNYLFVAFMALGIYATAQPVSGYLGKRMATSFEFQIIPGLQGDLEPNTSTFLAFLTDSENGFSYVPRWLANFEYQYARNTALSVGIGYASMHTYVYYPSGSEFYYPEAIIQPIQTGFLQIRVKRGRKGMIMPTASSYVAYGIGLYSIHQAAFTEQVNDNGIDEFSMDAVSAFDFSFNFEIGRRAVFKHGIFLEYGVATNISRGLLYAFGDEYSIDISDPDYHKKEMMGRVALNSLFNLKLAIGLLY